jgi:hypothetical protein
VALLEAHREVSQPVLGGDLQATFFRFTTKEPTLGLLSPGIKEANKSVSFLSANKDLDIVGQQKKGV